MAAKEPAMNLAALKLIPWKQIVTWAPIVMKMVRELKQDAHTGPAQEPVVPAEPRKLPPLIAQLEQRIASLEAHQAQQAEIFSKMAEQTQALSEGLRVLAARLILLAWLAGAALLVSVAVLVWTAVR
jgi:hypothetical protein